MPDVDVGKGVGIFPYFLHELRVALDFGEFAAFVLPRDAHAGCGSARGVSHSGDNGDALRISPWACVPGCAHARLRSCDSMISSSLETERGAIMTPS